MKYPIGKYLEYLRLACGYSLREAAKRTQLSHGYIRDVELGDKRVSGNAIVPRPKTLQKFANAYSVPFNELMEIAGHLPSEIDIEFIELQLEKVLYLEVNCNNTMVYHLEDTTFLSEKLALHDFIKFEEQLECDNFLRIQSGVYANLKKIKFFDKKKGMIYFNHNLEGKSLSISWIRASKLASIIEDAIMENSNVVSVPTKNFKRVIRNIVSDSSN